MTTRIKPRPTNGATKQPATTPDDYRGIITAIIPPGAKPIKVTKPDYDETRYLPVRVRVCSAKADLGEHGMFEARVEDAIDHDGRVAFCLSLAASHELVVVDLTPGELDTIVAAIQGAVAAAQKRGILERTPADA